MRGVVGERVASSWFVFFWRFGCLVAANTTVCGSMSWQKFYKSNIMEESVVHSLDTYFVYLFFLMNEIILNSAE